MKVDLKWPSWAASVEQSLAVHPQFVLSGNIRDLYLVPTENGLAVQPMIPTLWELLSRRGYQCLIVYDPADGVRVYPSSEHEAQSTAEQLLGERLSNGRAQISTDQLADWLSIIAKSRDGAAAFIIDYASRIINRPTDLTDVENELFIACEKLAHTTNPLPREGAIEVPHYNPIIWLINRENDLPEWFAVGNEAVRSYIVGMPDWQMRMQAAEILAKSFPSTIELSDHEKTKFTEVFADLTDGLTIRSMMSISQLARDQSLPLFDVVDAVRAYKVGVFDNPWKKEYLKEKIRSGHDLIGDRVKGQDRAVRKALDILTRSAMGLSGAQVSSSSNRPRGVLFFAGPTGVGKTELAKAVTELIFGDEQAYVRFDMSEFSAEQSEARLLGAPPGYIGHDAGGELVTSIRQRPFSVVLFDEIEKAHPRILDKFLQILEDGRITDGRGDTVFFTETVIIFTSNLGIYVENESGQRVLNVTSDDKKDVVESKVKGAIENYFRFDLQRPELLNRIGDNIVVFDFIRDDVAGLIFDKMLKNIVSRVQDEHGVALVITDETRKKILQMCTSDLSHGGRGIGNRLETVFINPLSHTLFNALGSERHSFTITKAAVENGVYSIEMS